MINFTRKIQRNGRGTYSLNLPKEALKNLNWRERQKVLVRQVGNKLIIVDWPQK